MKEAVAGELAAAYDSALVDEVGPAASATLGAAHGPPGP